MESEDGFHIRVRLYGIDAPEQGQDYGSRSRDFLDELCFGREVEINPLDIDQFGRTLAIVSVDGININEEMVRNGLAWSYKRFAKDSRLASLEQLARNEGLNIWSLEAPMHPSDFRKMKREDE